MSKFNATKSAPVNFEGARTWSFEKKDEFFNLVMSSYMEDTFYRSANSIVERFRELVDSLPSLFVAKTLLYARTVMGLRSIVHYGTCLLISKQHNDFKKNEESSFSLKAFIKATFLRPDDMLEVVSLWKEQFCPKLNNSLKRAVAETIEELNPYQMAKYKASNKEFSLVDLVNLTHPNPNKGPDGTESPISQLVKGTLAVPDTWEVSISACANDSEKSSEWSRLVNENVLGDFALLRNLRNIARYCERDVFSLALDRLVERSKTTQIAPYYFYTAYKTIMVSDLDEQMRTQACFTLSQALENVIQGTFPSFNNTLVLVDVSGSMRGSLSNNSVATVAEAAAVMAASIVLKSTNSTVIAFHTEAYEPDNSQSKSVVDLISRIINHSGGATYLFKALELVLEKHSDKKYERIVILSDTEAYGNTDPDSGGNGSDFMTVTKFLKKMEIEPFVYYVNMMPYGHSLHPKGSNPKHFDLFGFNAKFGDLFHVLEEDREALHARIDALEF